ncbi:MAG: hypothetical protein M5R42_19910 [Rhodocyclaceae bacterium]|nr:hypothetical protein [Rhodocyclaceae bacterium]
MDEGARGDAGDDVGPDLADDFLTWCRPEAKRSDQLMPSKMSASSACAARAISRTQSSSRCSSFSRPITQPAKIATESPMPR